MNDLHGIGYELRLSTSMEGARASVQTALSSQGFGVLTDIDVQATLREKLGVEVPEHVILGVCNPQLANEALSQNPAVGLLLPCNVTLRQVGGEIVVSWLRPTLALGIMDDSGLTPVAEEAERRLNLALAPLDPVKSDRAAPLSG